MVRKSGENIRGRYSIEEKISGGGRFVKEDRSDLWNKERLQICAVSASVIWLDILSLIWYRRA